MIFSELKTDFYAKVRENSSNSTFSDSIVSGWLNEGYNDISRRHAWDFFLYTLDKVLVSTTVNASSTSTSQTVSSTSNMFICQK